MKTYEFACTQTIEKTYVVFIIAESEEEAMDILTEGLPTSAALVEENLRRQDDWLIQVYD